MFKTNKNYLNLKESYLFTDIAKKVAAYSAANPDKKLIKMGIGDVTQPLIPEVVEAMKKAAGEMGIKETFRGYGPEQGYGFLREKIAEYYLREMNVKLAPDEIFVSDGAKSDVGNFTDLLSNDNVIVVPDPVYPVYVDSNVMLGRKINYISGNEGMVSSERSRNHYRNARPQQKFKGGCWFPPPYGTWRKQRPTVRNNQSTGRHETGWRRRGRTNRHQEVSDDWSRNHHRMPVEAQSAIGCRSRPKLRELRSRFGQFAIA